MDHMLVNARIQGDVTLSDEALEACKQYNTVALYGSVQFIDSLPKIQQQLEGQGTTVITSQPDRTNSTYQILGCDAFYDSLKLPQEPDAFLYVGDGIFHPRALVLAQKDQEVFKPIIRYDPMQDKVIDMGIDDCRDIFVAYRTGLVSFMTAKNVGVVVTVKPGQQQFKVSRKLRETYPDKNIYYFAENTLDFTHLEDFPFIDVWINSACPRIGFDDAAHMPVNMINVTDALKARDVLSKESILTQIKPQGK